MNTDFENEKIDILLIESDPKDAAVMLQTLEQEMFSKRVLWLEDGIQAMEFLNCKGVFEGRDLTNTPKIIFLDIWLPKKDGIKILHEIKNTPQLKDIPVIFISSSLDDLTTLKRYEAGANGYELKPVNFSKYLKVPIK